MTVRKLREHLERLEREGHGPKTVAYKQNNDKPGTKNLMFPPHIVEGRAVIE